MCLRIFEVHEKRTRKVTSLCIEIRSKEELEEQEIEGKHELQE